MAITASVLWLDGALVETSTAGVPLMAHALQRGSLVFDVGSFQAGALFRARDHVRRFLNSARIVGLDLREVTEEALLEAAIAVARASKASEGMIRWSAFFAADNPDLIPRAATARIAVAAQLYEKPPTSSPPPIKVATFEDARKGGPSVLPPDAKASAAYLGPMLARKRAIAAGADEVVLLDEHGDIAEGPIANTFCVIGGELWTPPLGRILPGITRHTVLALARELGVVAHEASLTRSRFCDDSEEAFMSGTSLPLAPIAEIDKRSMPAPGPLTTKLLAAVRAARFEKTHPDWLVPL